MSSAYFTKRLKVPDEFPEILKGFTREILRNQPSNIYEFGANYFAEMSMQARMAAEEDEAGAPPLMSAAELEDFLMGLFADSDSDGNNVLDLDEFKEIMIAADIGLSEEDIYRIMEEADENGDGQIEYREFVPVAAETIQALQAREQMEARETEMLEDAEFAAEMYLSRGLSKDELDAIIKAEFQKADVNGDGVLSRAEFKTVLSAEALGLSSKEIKALMLRVDQNDDGVIQYDEFAPLCFELLLQRFKRSIYDEARDSNELKQYLEDVFAQYDEADSGLLTLTQLRAALRDSDLGLTPIKVHSILAEAMVDDVGMVEFRAFAHTAASMLEGFLKPLTQEEATFMSAAAQLGGAELLPNFDRTTLEETLAAAFGAADGGGTGTLSVPKALEVIGATELGLSAKQAQSLANAGVDGEGADGMDVQYERVVELAWDLLVLVAREDFVNRQMKGGGD